MTAILILTFETSEDKNKAKGLWAIQEVKCPFLLKSKTVQTLGKQSTVFKLVHRIFRYKPTFQILPVCSPIVQRLAVRGFSHKRLAILSYTNNVSATASIPKSKSTLYSYNSQRHTAMAPLKKLDENVLGTYPISLMKYF